MRVGSTSRVIAALIVLLAALLAWLQYKLWFGQGGAGQVQALQHAGRTPGARQHAACSQRNEAARRGSRRPQVGRSRGRRTRAQRTGHDQAGRDVLSRGGTDVGVERACSAGDDRSARTMRPKTRADNDLGHRARRRARHALRRRSSQAISRHRRRAADRACAAARCCRIRRSAARWSCCRKTTRSWPGWTADRRQAGAHLRRRRRARDSVLAGLGGVARRRAPPTISCSCTMPRVRTCAPPISNACSTCGRGDPVGAILAAPVRDTLKRARRRWRHRRAPSRANGLWRALTPQLFRRLQLTRALEAARARGVVVTDEAMAMERQGHRPLLVEGSDDNLKVTTPADLRAGRIPPAPRARTHMPEATP